MIPLDRKSGMLPVDCPELAVVRCAACGVPLTAPLRLLMDSASLGGGDGEPIIGEGRYCPHGNQGHTAWEWVVNLNDALNTRHHPDSRRLNGCCGSAGLDGINVVCVNGHEVATERSDCWMAHGLYFAPAKVVVVGAAR
jgi:hypothetical protein